MTCGRANRCLRRNRTAASRSRMAKLRYTRLPCPVPLVLPVELLRHKIEGACLFHAVTRSAGIAASSYRRWTAFAVRLPCPQGPHGGLTAHGIRTAFTCTPHEKPHAADIRTRLDGTGEARSATTGFSIRKCSPCRAVSPCGGGEAFAYEHSPGRGVAGLLHHARS